MKIVVSGYVGKKITGIGRNLICLLENSGSGNRYILYVNRDMVDQFCFANENIEVRTYRVSKNSSMLNLLWTTFVFPFVAAFEGADIALIPNFTFLLYRFLPTAVIMHDLIEFNVPRKFSRIKMFYRTKIANPLTARLSSKLITVSENSKCDIVHFLDVNPDKIVVIPNGVDRRKFSPVTDAESYEIISNRGWPTNFILYAGTIDHPGKNSMSVVKVFEKLKREGLFDGGLILAGMPGAGYAEVVEYVNSSAFCSDITFTGYVSDDELVALYSRCKVFCFFSLYEGFGIPPLEALACGAKVVTSNTSSLPEVIGDAGWLSSPNAIDEMYNSTKQALVFCGSEEHSRKVEEQLAKFRWEDLSKSFESALVNAL